MAAAFVQAWTGLGNNNNGGGTTGSITTTAGNTLFYAATCDLNTFTLSDSKTNTWSIADGPTNNTGDYSQGKYVLSCLGGASHTLTIAHTSPHFSCITGAEYSGISALDAHNITGTGNSTTLLSSTATTSVDNCMVIGYGNISAGTNNAFTGAGGLTVRSSVATGSTTPTCFMGDKLATTAGGYTASATWSGSSGVWICGIATFRPVAVATDPGFDQSRAHPPGRMSPATLYPQGDWTPSVSAVVTNAPAELASGTGQAFDITASIAPTAGNAAGTGAASNAKATVAPVAGNAAGTGSAFNASESEGIPAGLASGTGTAYTAKATVAPVAGLAAGTGTAYDATANTAAVTNAPAGLASGTGTAYNATATVAPTAGNAAGTGTSYTAKATVAPVAGAATGTGTAFDATASTATVTNAPAGNAAGTGTAFNAKATIAPTAGAASGTGTAFNASVTIAPKAGVATATGTAYGPVCSISANAGVATGTGSAYGIKCTIAPVADVAAGTGTAYGVATSSESGIGATFLASRRPMSELVSVGANTAVLRPTVASAVASPQPGTLLQPTRTNTEIVDE